MMTTVETAVDNLCGAFEEFKAAQDTKLKALEKKQAVDPLLDAKISRLSKHMDRLEEAHLKSARPTFDGVASTFEDLEHKAAFTAYLRRGETVALEAKSLSASRDQDGGYLIPQVITERLNQQLDGLSPLRAKANVVTISSSALEMLVNKDGAASGWSGEEDARDDTASPTLQKITIPTFELYAKPRATQKLLDDAFMNVEAWIAERVAMRMAQMENQAFLNGDGQTKPKGILSYDLTAQNNWSWGKLAAFNTGMDGAIESSDVLIDMIHSLKSQFQNGACWIMSRSAQAAIRKLKDQNGQYLWQPGLGQENVSTLLGYEVVVSDDMSPLTSGTASNSVLFGNFKEGYQIVDRKGISVMRDPYSAKPHVEFYTTKRVGGDVVNFDAIKVLSCTQ